MLNKTAAIAFVLSISVVFMYADTTKAQIVKEGLVSYWTLDEADTDGKAIEDVWGNNDGTIMGDPEMVEGKIGDALKFDGIDDYVDCGNDGSLDFGRKELTVAAWFKTTGVGVRQGKVRKRE